MFDYNRDVESTLDAIQRIKDKHNLDRKMKIKNDIKLDLVMFIEPLVSEKTLTRKSVDIEILARYKSNACLEQICLVQEHTKFKIQCVCLRLYTKNTLLSNTWKNLLK